MDEKLPHLKKKDTLQRMSPYKKNKEPKIKRGAILFNCTLLQSIKRQEHSSFSDINPSDSFQIGNSGERLCGMGIFSRLSGARSSNPACKFSCKHNFICTRHSSKWNTQSWEDAGVCVWGGVVQFVKQVGNPLQKYDEVI